MFIKRPFTPRHSSQILELNTLQSHATKMEIPTLSEGQMAQVQIVKTLDLVLRALEFNLKSVNGLFKAVCIKSVDVCDR